MNHNELKLIGKYAWVLSISYVLELAFSEYVGSIDVELEMAPIQMMIPIAFSLLLNIGTALVVYRDKVKLGINTKYVMITTLLYRPVGVVAFLLYAVYDKSIIAAGEASHS
jgi:hypothetical protein